ncbi:hypothetical protein E2C01_006028 [Portunus trituberculatus]|uniref:Uncharacterized protein n=1 Tax=Portunus trituberculatus TaxID=210409 RepID=A0A5B7CVT0_PORTR|nr:hypothetical protein [Portunus trituberculatus]
MSESDRSMGITMPSLSFQPSSPLDMVCVAPHMAGGTARHGTARHDTARQGKSHGGHTQQGHFLGLKTLEAEPRPL